MRYLSNPTCVAILVLTWTTIPGAGILVQAAGEPASSTAEMLADAELHDVLFLDPDRGWAVGDRGVIWQTETGGRRWHLVDSPTTARLRSIHFADPQHGWIAGGWIHSFTHRSSAVVLRTDNGGKKWIQIDVSTLPALRQVHFTDARNGWALGDSSALYGAGLFRTKDGGYTWESPPAMAPLSISTGAVIDSRRACLIAADSSAWSFNNNALVNVARPGELGLRPRAVRFSDGRGWLVGDRGIILRSDHDERNWSAPSGKLPDGVAAEFDWLAVAVLGEQCWIAGAPGSCVLHSPDGGRSWRTFLTGQTLPINQLHFLDDHHGWAVGPMGRVLATRDGGQTWRMQLSAGERAGLLAVHGRAEAIPLELFAKVSADEGYLAATTVLYSNREGAGAGATLEDRLRDACSAVGVTATQTLTLSPPQLATDSRSGDLRQSERNARPEGNSIEHLERVVIRQLRMWRPDVVLTDNITAQENHPRGYLAGQAVLQAVQRAADPAVFPDQIVVAGLQPWTVRKLFGVVRPQESASVTIDTSRLSMQLGCSLADYTVPGRGILSNSWTTTPRSIGCRLLWSQATQEVATRDIFSGIPLTAVGETRRAPRTPPQSRLEGLTRTAQLLRNLQEIAARGVGSEANVAAVFPQIEQLMQGQEPAAAGRLLYRLAQQFMAAGQYPAAGECLAALVDRFPDHALNDAALLWLIRYHGSSEMQHAFGPRRLTRLPSVSVMASVAAPEAGRVQPTSFALPSATAPHFTDSDDLLRTVRIAELIRQTRPALYADPRVQFPLVSVERRLGKTSDTTRLLNVLSSSQLAQEWRAAARGEQKLLEREARTTRPTVTAALASPKPLLDGKLDDPCWQTATCVRCPSAESGLSTELMLAYDDEYVFVALRCTTAMAESGDVLRDPRVRDASLTHRDRVELDLDVDRDYQTYYRFTIDQHGWTNDACGDDPRWNPQWFVATGSSESEWMIEGAIPRSELTAASPARGDMWCVRLRRMIPVLESQSWPESTFPDSGINEFALLFFADLAVTEQ